MQPTRFSSRRTDQRRADLAAHVTALHTTCGWQAATRTRARTALREAVFILAGTAAIALVGQVRLPLPWTPVPMSLGTLAVLGVGAVSGPSRGAASAAVLALLAGLGAPVLTGWQGGVGATFGYVLGYLLAAAVAGWVARAFPQRQARLARLGIPARLANAAGCLGGMLLASALVYLPGVAWLAAWTGTSLSQAVVLGVVPFLVGDALKSLVVAGAVTAWPGVSGPAMKPIGQARRRRLPPAV